MHLVLPWPISVNAYYQNVPGTMARRVSADGRDFRDRVRSAIRLRFGALTQPAFEGPVRVDVELRAPDCRKRDIDNHIKSLFDALTHARAWRDDHQVDEMTVRRGQQISGGRAIVIISALAES